MKNRKVLQICMAAFIVTCAGGEAVSQSDFWQKISEDSVQAIAINSTGSIFASRLGRVVRSSDDGATWTETNAGMDAPVWNIAFTSSTVFAAGFGLLRSTDNGSNWTMIDGRAKIFAIAVNESGHIFIGWENESGWAAERSTDNGASWINTGLVFGPKVFAINASGTIFAGGLYLTNACVSRSTNNGTSWTSTIVAVGAYVTTLAINPAGHIFAGTSSGGA